jgi:hypothetical protein
VKSEAATRLAKGLRTGGSIEKKNMVRFGEARQSIRICGRCADQYFYLSVR